MRRNKRGFARLLSFALILALLAGILPLSAAGSEGYDEPLANEEGPAYLPGQTPLNLYEPDGGAGVGFSKPSLATLSGARAALGQAAAPGDSEEYSYVEGVAEALTEPEGMVGLDGMADDEVAYVFVWLTELPAALEQVYTGQRMSVPGYRAAMQQAIGARDVIRNMADGGGSSSNSGGGTGSSSNSGGGAGGTNAYSAATAPAQAITIEWEYFHIFSGFALRAPVGLLKEIAEIPGVYMITEVGFYEMDYIPDPDYTTVGNAQGRKVANIADLHAAGIDGSGVNVGVIDAGIQTDHPDIAGAYKGGYNFVRNTASMSTPDGNHGAHVAGIIASQGIGSLGIAPGVNLYVAQVFDPSLLYLFSSGSDAVLTAAIEAFSGGPLGVQLGFPQMDVVNMSLGYSLRPETNSAYVTGSYARNNAVIAGTLVVNSAGNSAYQTSTESFPNDRRSYSLTSGSVSLPITVAAAQYGGEPSYVYNTSATGAGEGAGEGTDAIAGVLPIAVENFDRGKTGLFPDGSFGFTETHTVTYNSSNTTVAGNILIGTTTFLDPAYYGTYTRYPLVYTEGKGYELYYASPTTGDMTADEMNALKALPKDSLIGKILVVNRGIAFGEYLGEALRLGAGALIVMNREENYFDGFMLSFASSANMPVFSSRQSGKQVLLDAADGNTAYIDPGALVRAPHIKEPAPFSSLGPVFETAHIKPDVTAPGYSVLSLDLGGDYALESGTSMSSPYVAAVAALVKQAHPGATPAEIKARIMNTADPYLIEPLSGRLSNGPNYMNPNGTESSVFEQGAGFVNPKRAVYDDTYIMVEHEVPTGQLGKQTMSAQMASFSFGNTEPGQTTDKMSATVYGGQGINSIRVEYSHDTRYSNKNLDGSVAVFAELTGADTFDVWLEVRDHASKDGSAGSSGNLYEGYIFVNAGGKEYVLPWATRVGETPVSPPPALAIENKGWLLYPDRAILSSWNNNLRDNTNWAQRSMMYLSFETSDAMDNVVLREVPITTGANAGKINYFLDLYYIPPFDTPEGFLEGDVVPAYRWPVPLPIQRSNNNTHAASDPGLKLSDFLVAGEIYIFNQYSSLLGWDRMGLPMQAQAYNPATGTFATANSSIAAGNYQVGLLFENGYDYFLEFGFTVASLAPELTIFNASNVAGYQGPFGDFTLPTTGHGSGTASASYAQNAMTIDLYGLYDFGATEFTVEGRMFDPAIEQAKYANQAAADALAELDIYINPGFVWAGYYMYNANEVVPLDQSFNIFGRTRDSGTRDYTRFNGDYRVCDGDGYFKLTFPTPANKAGGFMINDPGISYNRLRAVSAFEMTYGILESGGLLGGVPGWYESGALVSPFWRHNIAERRAHVTVVFDPAGGEAYTDKENGLYYSTDSVTLTAQPAGDYFFLGWFGADGHRLSVESPYTFSASVLTGDTEITAMFADEPTVIVDGVKNVVVIGRETQGQVVASALTGGFSGAIVFSVAPELPAGLAFDTQTGAITVAFPDLLIESETKSYTVSASDEAGNTASDAVDITVCHAPAITTDAFEAGLIGVPYLSAVEADGTKPIVFSIASGALPVGLSLSSDGLISGTPAVGGLFTFTIAASNISGAAYADTAEFTISVAEKPVIMTYGMPDGHMGQEYLMRLTASGTQAEWSVTDGWLPAGLKLSPQGFVTGIPEESGSFRFVVKVENAGGSDEKELTVRVFGTLCILTEVLPDGITGLPYAAALEADTTAPVEWSITDGALPAGLALDSETGLISGVTMSIGEFTFTVTADNGVASDSKEYTLSFSIIVMSATPRASVDKLNGNQNRLHIWVKEVYSDGSTREEYLVVMIANNAAAIYTVGSYRVYVDTKGNDQIRACYIVS